MLEEQLKFANNVINRLTLQLDDLRNQVLRLTEESAKKDARIDDLIKQLQSLQEVLSGKTVELQKTQNKAKGLEKIAFTKSEKQVPSKEEKPAVVRKPVYAPQSRGNNNAKHKERYGLETVMHDIYPDDPSFDWRLMEEIGYYDSIRYEMIPAKFVQHIWRLHKYRVGETIKQGTLPPAPLNHSRFDGSFVAGVMELRYIYSMSVERIANYFSDHGFEIGKSTLNGLLKKTASHIENLYKALGDAVLSDKDISCDETYMKVLIPYHENHEGKRVVKGYMWAIIAKNLGLIYYFYENGSRKKDVIVDRLVNYRGTLQSDGFAPYRYLGGAAFPEIVRISCLQHVKRKFIDCEGDPDAEKMIKMINELYHYDHQHKVGIDGWTEEDNRKYRKSYAPKILKKIEQELNILSRRNDVLPDSDLGKAVTYMQNEMPDIKHIFQNGRNNLDNNLIERYNRYISLSRRNSLFFGSHAGASNGAIYYSLACSCRMQGINFFEYMSDILNRIAKIQPNSPSETYRSLLPDMWRKA